MPEGVQMAGGFKGFLQRIECSLLGHKWQDCLCSRCGLSRHQWHRCRCERCGQHRIESCACAKAVFRKQLSHAQPPPGLPTGLFTLRTDFVAVPIETLKALCEKTDLWAVRIRKVGSAPNDAHAWTSETDQLRYPLDEFRAFLQNLPQTAPKGQVEVPERLMRLWGSLASTLFYQRSQFLFLCPQCNAHYPSTLLRTSNLESFWCPQKHEIAVFTPFRGPTHAG